MNGGLNCSVLDGWWCEGYDASHGWAVGPAGDIPEGAWHNDGDADSLYRLLEEEIAPCYYRRDDTGLPREWIRRMKEAIASLSPRFCAQRMVQEYVERFYLPAEVGEPVTGRV